MLPPLLLYFGVVFLFDLGVLGYWMESFPGWTSIGRWLVGWRVLFWGSSVSICEYLFWTETSFSGLLELGRLSESEHLSGGICSGWDWTWAILSDRKKALAWTIMLSKGMINR